jgi:hypothetical protein
MLSYLWIAIGGALGTTARYWISGVVAQSFGETFPWGTLIRRLDRAPVRDDRHVRRLYDVLVV